MTIYFVSQDADTGAAIKTYWAVYNQGLQLETGESGSDGKGVIDSPALNLPGASVEWNADMYATTFANAENPFNKPAGYIYTIDMHKAGIIETVKKHLPAIAIIIVIALAAWYFYYKSKNK